MLLDTLTLAFCAMALATLDLLTVGRGQRNPSRTLSVLSLLFFTGAGAVCGMSLGVPANVAIAWALVSLILGALLIALLPDWNAAGHAALLFTVESAILYLAVAGVIVLFGSGGMVALTLGLLLWGMQLLGVTLGVSFAFEMLDVVCRRRWRYPEAIPPRMRALGTARSKAASDAEDDAWPPVASDWAPRVALQVPCHDEPPDVVIRTLEALARMDYPRDRYDVMVVDNNTDDGETWQPVAAACQRLGFTFLHLEKWPGYKSGALNYALALTPPDVEIIGVVDADYLVRPEYLRDLVGYFTDHRVAFVQTPQDYRDYRPESTFYQRASYHAYRYFFDLSMPSRNERNAIIFGGTMGLIRARALREIGGWDEWCITEDAEASLRLLARGWQGRFVNESYGKGLMPLEFDALKRQRFRWCFGGIQILRKHWHMLSPLAWRGRPLRDWDAPGLSLAQRYHYLMGGLQWYSDALTFAFTSLLLVTGWLLVAGRPVNLPGVSGILLVLPLSFWVTSLLRTLWALRATRRCSWGEAIGAVGILWSLSWVVTLASIQGAFRKKGVFLRTPKVGKANLLAAVRSTMAETALGLGCWGLTAALFARNAAHAFAATQAAHTGQGSLGVVATVAALIGPWWAISGSAAALALLAAMQGTVYLSAPALCLLSLRTAPTAREARRRALDDRPGEGAVERRLLVGAIAGVAALVALLLVASFSPSQTVSQRRQKTLSTLLGNSNPAVAPTATATGAPGSGSSMPTATATAGSVGAPTATLTSPTATTQPTATPRATPHATPPVTPQPTPTHHGKP